MCGKAPNNNTPNIKITPTIILFINLTIFDPSDMAQISNGLFFFDNTNVNNHQFKCASDIGMKQPNMCPFRFWRRSSKQLAGHPIRG